MGESLPKSAPAVTAKPASPLAAKPASPPAKACSAPSPPTTSDSSGPSASFRKIEIVDEDSSEDDAPSASATKPNGVFSPPPRTANSEESHVSNSVAFDDMD